MVKALIKPTKINCLERLCNVISFSSVVDVGVNEATPELIVAFPQEMHYLFEPVASFHAIIAENYKHVPHSLFPVALSDKPDRMFLVISSIMSNGLATHSQLSVQKAIVDGQHIMSCTEVDVCRYDDLEVDASKDFLLKVDVDGKDLEVLKGFGASLCMAAAIIVECTVGTLSARLAFCVEQGFELFDIVDLCYYGSCIYQFDLVFVRKDMMTNALKPNIRNFDQNLWVPGPK